MQPLVSSLSAGDCPVHRLTGAQDFVHQVGNQPRLTQAMYVRNIEACSQNHCCSGKEIGINYS